MRSTLSSITLHFLHLGLETALCCVKDAWGGARVGVGQALQGAAMVVDCQCECIEGVSAYKPFKSFLNSGICTLGFHYNGWKLGQGPDVLCVAVWGS